MRHVPQPRNRLQLQRNQNTQPHAVAAERHVLLLHRRLPRHLRDRPVRRAGRAERLPHHHGQQPDRLGEGLSAGLLPLQHQRPRLRGSGRTGRNGSGGHLQRQARTHAGQAASGQDRPAGDPARPAENELAGLFCRGRHGRGLLRHRRRLALQGPRTANAERKNCGISLSE